MIVCNPGVRFAGPCFRSVAEHVSAFDPKVVQAWDAMLSSSDVANALATYRGTATHAVADLLGAPLAELECSAVEVTVNLRAPAVPT